MDYVQGETLSRSFASRTSASSSARADGCVIMAGVLHGLHAAHEAASEHGEPLGIVHRDVSRKT